MRREELADPDSQKVITTQLKDGVDVRVAFLMNSRLQCY